MWCRSSFLRPGARRLNRMMPMQLLVALFVFSLRQAFGFGHTFATTTHHVSPFPFCRWHTAGQPTSRSRTAVFRLRKFVKSRLHAQVLPTDESARQLTDFMAKAHEEKLRALKAVEDKYRDEITDLKRRLERYESQEGAALATTQRQANSFEFPATNKAMGEKIQAYRIFLADYIVKSQNEKLLAVATAERKMKERYELIIAEMRQQHDAYKP